MTDTARYNNWQVTSKMRDLVADCPILTTRQARLLDRLALDADLQIGAGDDYAFTSRQALVDMTGVPADSITAEFRWLIAATDELGGGLVQPVIINGALVGYRIGRLVA